jgi:hypothetical protein
MGPDHQPSIAIRTPDQRLRVFVSSTLSELAPEREAVRRAVERPHLTPVLFELGTRPHPPRELYRAYLEQSDVFLGIYWERHGWVAPGERVSGLEDEYRLAGRRPRLLYLEEPAPDRKDRLSALLADLEAADLASYKRFSTPEQLEALVVDDLAVLLLERFGGGGRGSRGGWPGVERGARPDHRDGRARRGGGRGHRSARERAAARDAARTRRCRQDSAGTRSGTWGGAGVPRWRPLRAAQCRE